MIGNHISLFSGVGMLDLAAEAAGFKTLLTAENNPFCQGILRKRFPDAVHLDDVTEVGAWPMLDRRFVGRTKPGEGGEAVLMTGGFPCTDLSGLGARAGLSGARSGLWFEYLRAITELQPDYVLIENVTVLRSRGMDEILRGLWGQHYHIRWECIPAAVVGAPHLRDRLWIMARKTPFAAVAGESEIGDFSADAVPPRLPRSGRTCYQAIFETKPQVTLKTARLNAQVVHGALLPTPRSAPNEWRTTRNAPTHGNGHGKTLAGELNDRWRAAHPNQTPPKSSESAGNVDPIYVEWMMGLPFGWTDPEVVIAARDFDPAMDWRDKRVGLLQTLCADTSHRRERLMALGNGLVPQVARIALDILVNG